MSGKKKTHEDFINEVIKKNDYVEVLEKYQGDRVPISFRCILHKYEWKATPNAFLSSKYGCIKCSREHRSRQMTKSCEEFTEELFRI